MNHLAVQLPQFARRPRPAVALNIFASILTNTLKLTIAVPGLLDCSSKAVVLVRIEEKARHSILDRIRNAPARHATTGQPAAIASSNTRPSVSVLDGSTNMSAEA